jgi:hypothetical protein
MTNRPLQTAITEPPSAEWVAFAGTRRVAAGDPRDVASKVKALVDADPQASVLIFDARSSHMVELDLRGSADAVLRRLPRAPQHEAAASIASTAGAPRGPGRPKLGVVAREVTLLPRHWDWLASQPGGASVALRKLVDEARRATGDKDRQRAARDAAYHFMSAMAGNFSNFEEASRALFAHDRRRFAGLIADWPADIRDHIVRLAYSDGGG